MEKICRTCKEIKNEDDFYWKNKKNNIKQTECKNCTKKIVSNHYYNNKKFYSNRTQFNKQIKKDFLKEYKSGLKCSECNEDHPSCLDFHHVDPKEKNIAIPIAVNRNWSIDNIKKEIEKCIVLCANCHRKLHWNEKHKDL